MKNSDTFQETCLGNKYFTISQGSYDEVFKKKLDTIKADRENIPTKTTKENTDIMTHFICECFHNMNSDIWVKVFKNGPSQICGRQPLNFLK